MTAPQSLSRKLEVLRLGQRAEGLARDDNRLVAIAHALPGETIIAEVDGERGKLVEILTASPDRIAPVCRWYGTCGGCAIQVLAAPAYAVWKRDLVAAALAHVKVEAPLGDLVDAHGKGRRRATFHARVDRDALDRQRIEVGFMQARAHQIVEIDDCPILDPALAGALSAARAVARVLAATGKPLDIVVTATREGLDLDFRGTGPLGFDLEQALIRLAETLDLARISNHGSAVIERRPPVILMGRAQVALPPGGFLQATEAGEAVLAGLVQDAVGRAARIADLFAGVGTFTHRLAETAEVHAVESDAAALLALQKAAHGTAGLRTVTVELRDLNRRPLMPGELTRFDAVVCDPPRAGAEEQMRALAASKVPVAVSVSCNVQTFARDAAILVAGGYALENVTSVDQFRHSAHVEMVGVFRRARVSAARRRRLLG